jgi:hypothetical protein
MILHAGLITTTMVLWKFYANRRRGSFRRSAAHGLSLPRFLLAIANAIRAQCKYREPSNARSSWNQLAIQTTNRESAFTPSPLTTLDASRNYEKSMKSRGEKCKTIEVVSRKSYKFYRVIRNQWLERAASEWVKVWCRCSTDSADRLQRLSLHALCWKRSPNQRFVIE